MFYNNEEITDCFVIQGDPIPLKRPRMAKGHLYDPQVDEKMFVGFELRRQNFYMHHRDEPLTLDVTFFMPIPKSLSKKKQQALIGKPHKVKPDLSNLIKFIEDAANGILFDDDALIAKITAQKIYDENPRTEFKVTVCNEECRITEKDGR